jgi:RHS repeat-associated protein
MVDSLGTTRYTYDAAGQLLTASGPFSSDTLTNTYSNRRRVALALQEPSGHVWTNGFGWDLAGRLTSVTSPAGGFAYAYMALDSTFSGRLVQELAFPSGAYITNFYDPVARLVGTVLESSGSSALDAALYGYNEGNQRTAYTNAAGAYDLYTYDPIGQLKVGTSSTVSEDRGYGYDAAWNLNYLTNNGMAIEFDVDNRNELTSVVGQSTLTYDANGNLLTGTGTRVGAGTNWNYIYDDENRLVQWFYYQNGIANPATGDLRTDFRYDGLGRLRQRLEYLYNAPTNLLLFAGWNPQSTNEYLYDGWRVLQERDGSNVPLVSYTRGNDLSGTLEGAGGIGGLLARSSGYSSGNWTSHAYYHADGNGNITCLINASQSVVARYRYDPFGNTLSQSGTLAVANVYRFSSKEIHTNSLMYYYGYRFYDPGLQRWLNRDPIAESGFDQVLQERVWFAIGPRLYFYNVNRNLYLYLGNDPVRRIDPLGLIPTDEGVAGGFPQGCGPEQACKNVGGKWTKNNGYSSWQECMDKNWRDDPPSSGPPMPHGDLPPIVDILSWLMHSAICNHAGCSTSPSHFFPGS